MSLSGVPFWSWPRAYMMWLGIYILLMLLLTFAVQIVGVSTRSPVLKGLEEIGKMQSQVMPTELVMSELDTQTLYHHLLEHLAPQVEAIDSRYGKDWLELDIALQPEKLLLLDQLPIWPGWQLQSFIMQPKDGSWQLSMRWQSGKQTNVSKKLPKPATNLDISTWRSMLAPLPEQQITNNEDKKNLPIDYPNWQYLGYVGNQPTIGAWVREVIYSQDGQHNHQNQHTYYLREGDVWQDWKIISITSTQLELKRAGQLWILPSCMQLKSC